MRRVNVVGSAGSGKTTFGGRRDYPILFAQEPNLRVVRLRSPGQARRFLASVSSPEPAPAPTAGRS